MQPAVICLMGPTASGKTDLAIALAEQIKGELISVDSALVYRGLDIGSAKPTYPHHLINLRDPAEPYNVADFVRDADQIIADIIARGATPILVGGTMMYFKAFLDGLSPMPSSDPSVREQIEQEARERGWPALHEELGAVDPIVAAAIHPQHSSRITRALEVFRASGTPLSDWQRADDPRTPPSQLYRISQFALAPERREVLHDRIALRFEHMLRAGLIDEVRGLRARPDLHPDLPAIRAVGYRQVWGYLNGEYDLERCESLAVAATRQLAKRQLTWLRKWPDLEWLLTDEDGNLAQKSVSYQYRAEKKPLERLLNCIGSPP